MSTDMNAYMWTRYISMDDAKLDPAGVDALAADLDQDWDDDDFGLGDRWEGDGLDPPDDDAE